MANTFLSSVDEGFPPDVIGAAEDDGSFDNCVWNVAYGQPRGALDANLEFSAASDVSKLLVLKSAPSTAIQFFVAPENT